MLPTGPRRRIHFNDSDDLETRSLANAFNLPNCHLAESLADLSALGFLGKMPPEVKMERASANRNFTVIRATPAQTALLRAAYAHSNVASQHQLAELSEQTGL